MLAATWLKNGALRTASFNHIHPRTFRTATRSFPIYTIPKFVYRDQPVKSGAGGAFIMHARRPMVMRLCPVYEEEGATRAFRRSCGVGVIFGDASCGSPQAPAYMYMLSRWAFESDTSANLNPVRL